jgi:Arc/MetJ-type ribon-helix-helix transcriptional regulator
MSIQLTTQDETMVLKMTESGGYDGPDDVIHDALDAFQDKERVCLFVEAVEEGERAIVDGDVAVWTPALMKRIRAEAKEIVRTGETIDPDVLP